MDILWTNTSELKPSNAEKKSNVNNILGSFLDDKFLKKLNPRRYIYYKKFIRSLENPEKIRNFMYTLKNISENIEEKNKKVKKIIKLHEDLSSVNVNNPNYKNLKLDKIKDLNNKVLEILKNKTDSDFSDNTKNTKDDILKDITLYSPSTIQKGGTVEYLNDYSKKIEELIENKNDTNDNKLAKYKDILNEIDTVIEPDKSINITKEDRIVFIIFTFILRIICLTLSDWALNNNLINTFQILVISYSIIYLLILLIFTMLINITYKYNINNVNSGTTGFSNLTNAFYYFYLIPGASLIRNSRIFLHLIIIVMFMFVPFALKSKKDDNNEINYDYIKKKKFKGLLDKYTFVVWIFTSIIAINY